MLKKLILPLIASIALIYISYGCNMKVTSAEWGPTKTYTPIVSPTVTPTISPTSTVTATFTVTSTLTPVVGVFVGEAVTSQVSGFMNMTALRVALYEDTALGNSLTGATVDMGGWSLSETTPGIYEYSDATSHLFTSGATINLNISSSRGSASASVVMPKKVVMTAPASGGSISVGSNYNILWSYPDGTPSGTSTLAVIAGVTTYVNEDLPGLVTMRTIPAGTMTSGSMGFATIVTKNTGVITGATPGSVVFTCGWAGMNMFMTVP